MSRDLTTRAAEVKPPVAPYGATRDLLVVGCSARALAQSAVRAGFLPRAIDQFADRDLREVAPTVQVASWNELPSIAATHFPGIPCVYGGGLENHPDLLCQLADTRPLIGNQPAVLRRVRDPWQLRDWAEDHRFLMPELQASGWQGSGNWLRKPYRSGGGRQIELHQLSGEVSTPQPSSPGDRPANLTGWYWQRWMAGVPYSAQFLGNGRTAWLWGVTRQLVGESWAGADQFVHVGNIGPCTLPLDLVAEIRRLGCQLASDFQLRGLFGVDGVLNDRGWWILEVNPRYTSAMELLEYASGSAAVALHMEACLREKLPDTVESQPGESQPASVLGKAILYARHPYCVPESLAMVGSELWSSARKASDRMPPVADLPDPGSPVAAGMPICTVFASGTDVDTVEFQLRQQARCWSGS